jgi:ubiquinone/menaquinone biosynthesis C-methylase UbiE
MSSDSYSAISRYYDAFLGPFLSRIRQDVNRIVADGGFRRILDVGCGTGAQLNESSRLGVETVGVDTSISMLMAAQAKCGGSASFALADGGRLPFADGRFDLVIISLILHELDAEKRRGILSEAARVAGGDGSVLLIDYSVPRGFWSRAAFVLVDIIERLAGREHYNNFKNFIAGGGLQATALAAGLVPVLVRNHSLGTISIMLAQWR